MNRVNLAHDPAQNNMKMMQLLERYNRDERPDKINLTVGVYTDASGHSPILKTVREAEYERLRTQTSKASFFLAGTPDFQQAVRTVLFPTLIGGGEDSSTQVLQTLGASGALHLAGHLINHFSPTAKIWISSLTWENHHALFSCHRGGFGTYKYQPFSPDQLCIESILEDLQAARPGDFVLLHVCCHNPTAMDPDPDQWRTLADFCAERQLIPLFDFAYQGLAHSIQQDAEPLLIFRERIQHMLVCSSFSKNMGIYEERTGALTLVMKDKEKLVQWHTTVKRIIRSTYSTPPMHGGFIVSHIINDSRRFDRWQQELAIMCNDLNERREAFLNTLTKTGILDAVLPYRRQKGMFLLLQLSPQQIDRLQEKFGIYLLENGRMCIASLSTNHMPRVSEALQRIL